MKYKKSMSSLFGAAFALLLLLVITYVVFVEIYPKQAEAFFGIVKEQQSKLPQKAIDPNSKEAVESINAINDFLSDIAKCKDTPDGNICFVQIKKFSEKTYIRIANKNIDPGSTILLFSGDKDSIDLTDQIIGTGKEFPIKFCAIEKFTEELCQAPSCRELDTCFERIFNDCNMQYYYPFSVKNHISIYSSDKSKYGKPLGEENIMNLYWVDDEFRMDIGDEVLVADINTGEEQLKSDYGTSLFSPDDEPVLSAEGMGLKDTCNYDDATITFPLYKDPYTGALCFIQNGYTNNLKDYISKGKKC